MSQDNHPVDNSSRYNLDNYENYSNTFSRYQLNYQELYPEYDHYPHTFMEYEPILFFKDGGDVEQEAFYMDPNLEERVYPPRDDGFGRNIARSPLLNNGFFSASPTPGWFSGFRLPNFSGNTPERAFPSPVPRYGYDYPLYTPRQAVGEYGQVVDYAAPYPVDRLHNFSQDQRQPFFLETDDPRALLPEEDPDGAFYADITNFNLQGYRAVFSEGGPRLVGSDLPLDGLLVPPMGSPLDLYAPPETMWIAASPEHSAPLEALPEEEPVPPPVTKSWADVAKKTSAGGMSPTTMSTTAGVAGAVGRMGSLDTALGDVSGIEDSEGMTGNFSVKQTIAPKMKGQPRIPPGRIPPGQAPKFQQQTSVPPPGQYPPLPKGRGGVALPVNTVRPPGVTPHTRYVQREMTYKEKNPQPTGNFGNSGNVLSNGKTARTNQSKVIGNQQPLKTDTGPQYLPKTATVPPQVKPASVTGQQLLKPVGTSRIGGSVLPTQQQQVNDQRNYPKRIKRGSVAATVPSTSLSFPALTNDVPNEINQFSFNYDSEFPKFFVIKSYSEDDVHKSVKYSIWTSTDNGNDRLDKAYRAHHRKGPLYLFFSVNASGQFVGVAQMLSPLDFNSKSDHWHQDKWNGQFSLKWIFIKDIPNSQFRHIRLSNNDNKPVTNSRDTQEILLEPGREMFRIFRDFKMKTSILDDFEYYNKIEVEERKMKEERAQKANTNKGSPRTETGMTNGVTAKPKGN